MNILRAIVFFGLGFVAGDMTHETIDELLVPSSFVDCFDYTSSEGQQPCP